MPKDPGDLEQSEFLWEDKTQRGKCKVCEGAMLGSWLPHSKLVKHSRTTKHARSAALVRESATSPAPNVTFRQLSAISGAEAASEEDDMPLSDYTDFYDNNGEPILFETGRDDPETERRLAQSLRTQLDSVGLDDIFPESDKYCANTGWAEFEPALQGSWTVQERMTRLFGGGIEPNWYPYPDKGLLHADVMFHSPRMAFSEAEQSAISSYATFLGASTVPSVSRLTRFATESLDAVGNPVRKFVSLHNNVYYLNDLRCLLSNDISNPRKRPNMQFYPVVGTSLLREFWHGRLWAMDAPDDILTPMIIHDGRPWFVDEVVKCADGEYFLPKRWVQLASTEGEMGAMGHAIQCIAGHLYPLLHQRVLRRAEAFRHNYIDLLPLFEARELIWPPFFSNIAKAMPNRWREIAAGRTVISLPLMLWEDDVSGNVSKQWNKHYNICASNLAQPRQALDQEFNIHFVGTSPHATPLELMEGVVRMVEEINFCGCEAFDVVAGAPVLFTVWIAILAGDNPLQSELCSHRGLRANEFCRICRVGGNRSDKRTAHGYSSLFSIGVYRTPKETRETVRTMLDLAAQAARTKVANLAQTSGVTDKFAQPIINDLGILGLKLRNSGNLALEVRAKLRTELLNRGGYFAVNPLLTVSHLDVHRATPIELLHTFLLGLVKYLWGFTVNCLEAAPSKKSTMPPRPTSGTPLHILQVRLQSLNETGWNLPKLNPSYLLQYKGGLIGKHFKSLAQCMPFVIWDLVSSELLEAWVLVGLAGPLLWKYDIDDKVAYEEELHQTLTALIHGAARVDPIKMISKSKLHMFVHALEHIQRNGPAPLFSTERYESYNSVFRTASILSNRQAPSRDISIRFAHFARVRHIVCGGYWFDKSTKSWTCAGNDIVSECEANPYLQKLLGLPRPMASTRAGTVQFIAEASRKAWKRTQSYAVKEDLCPPDTKVRTGVSLIAKNGDKAPLDSFLVYSFREKNCIGKLLEIVVLERPPASNTSFPSNGLILLESYDVGPAHPVLVCPQLIQMKQYAVVDLAAVLAGVNVQHDCTLGLCSSRSARARRQEREDTNLLDITIQHHNDNAYLLNLFSFHNNTLSRSLVPYKLQTPIFEVDPTAFRSHLATQIPPEPKSQTTTNNPT